MTVFTLQLTKKPSYLLRYVYYSTGIKNRAIIPDNKAGIDRLSIGYRSGPMDRNDNQVKGIRSTMCVAFWLGTIIACLFYIDQLTLYDTSERNTL